MISIRSYALSGVRRLTYGVAALMIACLPLAVSWPAGADCVPPPDPGPGVHHPVGADAPTFTYNCDSGLWENAHYAYDPATGETTPTDQPAFVYNQSTGKYDSGDWVYNAGTGQFVLVPFSVTSPPAGAPVIGGPTSISNTGAGSNNTINDNGGVTSGSTINGTGPNSNNTIDGTANNNGTTNNTTNANVTNLLAATANSGNATVIGNTSGGNAASGNAQDQANIVNMLQSTSNAIDGDTVTFVANINGDVNGDLMLDPSALGSLQNTSPLGNNNLTLNNQVNAGINNTIDLTANSGDASVSGNTSGGNATSGTAQTIANVINLINSAVMSGKSFVGTININGNLNGDILLPPDFVDQLIAANVPTVTITQTGPGSNNAITTNNGSSNTKVTNTNDEDITNNVNANASSGSANVSNNTSAGNATTGNATNSITAFNLTGSYVTGCNAILVFVNVSGKWVGLIVNAPAGATAAALGSCVSNNGPGNNTTDITNNSNLRITNNINSTANSGDASVTGNTKGGNAKSGNAKNAVNLLNVENSALSFRGWFGILFINVFGTWNGSFGINTAAGNPVFFSAPGAVGAGGFATFVPADPAAGGSSSPASFVPSAGISNTGPGSTNSIVLTAKKLPAKAQTHGASNQAANWLWAILGSIAFVIFVAGDRIYSLRRP